MGKLILLAKMFDKKWRGSLLNDTAEIIKLILRRFIILLIN